MLVCIYACMYVSSMYVATMHVSVCVFLCMHASSMYVANMHVLVS